jgi:choline dehydrogenase-like flavoprotein
LKKAIVVGSGAGGATVAKELQGRFQVMVLEAGREFHPFSANLSLIEMIKKTGLLFDEKLIQIIFPVMRIKGAADKMILVNGIGHGGTTTICAGNAVRKDEDLKAIGIDLDPEFQELSREIPVCSEHQKKWHDQTKQVFAICRDMGLQPVPTPKMANFKRCIGCGKCVLGCARRAKWDARYFLTQALEKGAELVSECKVQKVVVEHKRATGVEAVTGWRRKFYPADLVVLAAGGLGTPVILQKSGIECKANLFVDPVLCVAARIHGSRQNREIPMPFIVQRENYIISPYFDFLSFFFHRDWNCPPTDIFSLMIKLADSNSGSISNKRIRKSLTDEDKDNLKEGVGLCTEIFRRLGIRRDDLFLGTSNAGHPGGMLPLTESEARTLHSAQLPENCYVSDATLFPRSIGNPPILTIAAMSKRISKLCLRNA